MGITSGITSEEWSLNSNTGRFSPSGKLAAMAKAIGDAGAGGMTLLSPTAWAALSQYGMSARADAVFLHLGEYLVGKGGEEEGLPLTLYSAISKSLLPRLAFYEPLRTRGITSPSIMSAPVGKACIVFFYGCGLKSLEDKNAAKVLETYHSRVKKSLLEWGGYLVSPYPMSPYPLVYPPLLSSSGLLPWQVELDKELALCAFSSPGLGLSWALICQQELRNEDWDPDLLVQWGFEEVRIAVQKSAQPGTDGVIGLKNDTIEMRTILRGMRVKAGLDTGHVLYSRWGLPSPLALGRN